MKLFLLPDLGEGLTEAEIVQWSVKEGDEVKIDQPIVTMETDKALVDIPSPQSARVIKFYGSPGDIIHTGDPLLEFEIEKGFSNEVESQSNTVVGELPSEKEKLNESAALINSQQIGVKATPAVRALARKLDIDLTVVTPSGPNSTIKISDINRVAKIYSEVGKLEKLSGVRRTMAIAMTRAHAEVVAVTINDDANISHFSLNQDYTLRLIEAMVAACQAQPSLNSWYDSHSVGRRMIKQIHLGLAIDSKNGLFVPVIKDVASLDQQHVREKIDQYKTQIANRTISAKNLRGNTITLSNFGSIGGKYANPIVVPPTVCIVGSGRTFNQLKRIDGQISEQTYLPLSLTFDHRCVTGGEAARFLQVMIEHIQS